MATYTFPDVELFTLDATAADVNLGIVIETASQNDHIIVTLEHTGDSKLPEAQTTDSSLILRRSKSSAATTGNVYVENKSVKNEDSMLVTVPPGYGRNGSDSHSEIIDDASKKTADTLMVIVSITPDQWLKSFTIHSSSSKVISISKDWRANSITINTTNGNIEGTFPLLGDLTVNSLHGDLAFNTQTQHSYDPAYLTAHTLHGDVNITMKCDEFIRDRRRHITVVSTRHGDIGGRYFYSEVDDSFSTTYGAVDIIIVPSKAMLDKGLRPIVSSSYGEKNYIVDVEKKG